MPTPVVLFEEDDLLKRPKPRMLVDQLFIEGTLGIVVSVPGLCKSFVLLDLALSIASGQREFLGLPLHRCGPVVFVLGEGAGRFGLRIKAWKIHKGVEGVPLAFYWTNGPVNLLDGDEVAAFKEAIAVIQPSLVVFDTLSRCMVGADENAQEAMSTAVANLDDIRMSVPNMTVLVAHHTNASETRERGSSVLNGAVDTHIRLSRRKTKGGRAISEQVTLTTSKQKDLELLPRPLVLHQHKLTIPDEWEANGTASTSLVWVRNGEEGSEETPPAADAVLTYVTNHPGASKSAVVAALGGKKSDQLTHIEKLIADGRVVIRRHGQQHQLFAA